MDELKLQARSVAQHLSFEANRRVDIFFLLFAVSRETEA